MSAFAQCDAARASTSVMEIMEKAAVRLPDKTLMLAPTLATAKPGTYTTECRVHYGADGVQGADGQLAGALLLPVVARYLEHLRSPDIPARLMPSASYSLPGGG